MAVTQRIANANLRANYATMIMDLLANQNEDVGRVSAGVLNFPVVDENGNDSWIEITIKVPSGSRDGTPYDGYELREDYVIKQENAAERKAKADAAKAKKIARDEAARAAKAAKENKA